MGELPIPQYASVSQFIEALDEGRVPLNVTVEEDDEGYVHAWMPLPDSDDSVDLLNFTSTVPQFLGMLLEYHGLEHSL